MNFYVEWMKKKKRKHKLHLVNAELSYDYVVSNDQSLNWPCKDLVNIYKE